MAKLTIFNNNKEMIVMSKPKVVILGGGYGGLLTAKKLEKQLKNGEADVTLINKHDYHYITTMLHKTGAGTMGDNKITLPIRELLDNSKTIFKKATVSSLDFNNQKVMLEGGEAIKYDYLVVALGFDVETFGTPGIAEHAFNLRSFDTSKTTYAHIEKQFSLYNKDQDSTRLTFAVAGAGFTGIEMIGELVENLPKLAKKYNIPASKIRIINIEAAPHVLPGFEKAAVDYSTQLLKDLGVEVMTSKKILECTPEQVKLDGGVVVDTKTLVWSCGVRGHKLFDQAGLQTVRGKVVVDKNLKIPSLKNVFCIGDNSMFMKDEKAALPPTAQVALQQAPVCGENVIASIRGTSLKPFEYHHKGSVASISKRFGVGKIGNVIIKGKVAAFMKHVIDNRYLFVLGGPSLMIKQMVKSDQYNR